LCGCANDNENGAQLSKVWLFDVLLDRERVLRAVRLQKFALHARIQSSLFVELSCFTRISFSSNFLIEIKT
jgi:hypothetical protein